MKKIGLTGGIGVGKTFVSKIFQKMGYSVFFADLHAKKCIHESDDLKNEIKKKFGNEIYQKGVLQKNRLADIVFNDTKKLQELNNLVHPFVQRYFEAWCKNQQSRFVIKEAAILFESEAHKGLDGVICVSAPLQKRTERVMERDKCTREKVMKRMTMQMLQETKEKLSDFVIVNIENEKILPQILSVCKKIESL